MPYSIAEIANLSAGALNANLLPPLDVTDFRTVSLQVGGVFVGTLGFQGSNDGVTWFSTLGFNIGSNGLLLSATTGTGLFLIPVSFRFLRVQMISYTSGTATGTAEAYLSASLQPQSSVPISLPASLPATIAASAVQASAAVAVNTANSATLPAVVGKTNYLTGFGVTTQGGVSAAAGVVTITGLAGGTLTVEVGAAANTPVNYARQFSPGLPGTGNNVAIVVNVPALGVTTGAAACDIEGFVQ